MIYEILVKLSLLLEIVSKHKALDFSNNKLLSRNLTELVYNVVLLFGSTVSNSIFFFHNAVFVGC